MSNENSLWPHGVKIETIGVSGDFGSGKSLFCLTIDPKRTLCFDFEKSCGSYEALGFTRVDMPNLMQERYPSGYSQKAAFEMWLELVRKVEPGKFSTIVVDPITDIEGGLVDWVKGKYREYGFSSEDRLVSTGGIFWSKVRDNWKTILVDLATRCECFAFTAHLRKVWVGGRPTSKSEPKGKSTLREIASLYLILDRSPGPDGVTPEIPSASTDPSVGGKSRVARVMIVDGKPRVVGVLPPRIPECTPDAIRHYILNPPDHRKLKDEERIRVKEMTEGERADHEAQLAETRRATAEAEMEAAKAKERVEEARRVAMERGRG